MIIDEIARSTKIDPGYLAYVVRSASHRYKTYNVQKRKGGVRSIAHPSRELKFLQRWLARRVLSRLPVHPAALGYRSGMGIGAVAESHKNQQYLLLLDLQEFFASISYEDVVGFLGETKHVWGPQYEDDDCYVAGQILTRFGQVPIGAPSSPVLSNTIMYHFDQLVSQVSLGYGVVYSRYADDLQFSTNEPGKLDPLHTAVREVVRALPRPRLEINEDKTVFTSKKRRRMVVGLTLTTDNKISVGRRKKRVIKTMVFKYARGGLSAQDLSYLMGYLSYLRAVEPPFLETLRQKYGAETMGKLGIGPPVA